MKFVLWFLTMKPLCFLQELLMFNVKTLHIDSVDVFQFLNEEDYIKKLTEVYSQLASKPIINPLKSSYNQDIWYSKLKNGQTEGIYHPGYPINDVLPNSICSNYGMSNTFLVINQFDPKGAYRTRIFCYRKKQ